MAVLSFAERKILEDLLGMGSGYVLDLTDASYEEFFKDHGIDIEADKYHASGRSKAKRMRTFWEIGTKPEIAAVVAALLDYAEVVGKNVEKKHRDITVRLSGGPEKGSVAVSDERDFLAAEFGALNLAKLGLEPPIELTIQQRVDEIQRSLEHNVPLSAIFLAGSALEGLLLNQATNNPRAFNQARAAALDPDGKPLPFFRWSLSQLINVAHELGMLGVDVKKFSHALRDFRNYIHPYQQAQSRFMPDHHTARICWQVLRAAIAGLTQDR